MVNIEIANILDKMSSYVLLTEDKNAFFKARALQRASETLERFPHDLSSPEWINDINKIKSIEGIGQSIAKHIQDYVKLGYIPEYEEMKKQSPVNLEELLEIQGVGPKTVIKLYKEIGVTDLETLQTAAKNGQIADLEGFGQKSQDKILKSIEFSIKNKGRKNILDAEIEVNEILNYLSKDDNIKRVEPAGSYRRKKDTIGDIDLLAISQSPDKTMEYFVKYPKTESILNQGDTKSSIWLTSKIQMDLRILQEESFGAGMQYFTGSKEHNVRLRNHAIDKGYKLSEYGLFNRKTNELVESENEINIYQKLGLSYIEPELREDNGEIDLASKNKLPQIISQKDIKGDLHTHSTWSDGLNSIEEMVVKAKEMGYEYIGISDHFGKLKIANAIDETEFQDYIKDIKETDEKFKEIKVFASAEVEIGKDGELEFDKNLLKELDYVIASVHFSTQMSSDQMTKRIITALKNPLTKILAHPTGRIINKRPGFDFDYNEVFKVASQENVALEINSHPYRLDLKDQLVKLAIKHGCKIVINTDAHSINELEYIKYGVNVARRGWVQKQDLYYPI